MSEFAPIITALAVLITALSTSAVMIVRELRGQRVQLQEVHQLVNDRLDKALGEIVDLKGEVAVLHAELARATHGGG